MIFCSDNLLLPKILTVTGNKNSVYGANDIIIFIMDLTWFSYFLKLTNSLVGKICFRKHKALESRVSLFKRCLNLIFIITLHTTFKKCAYSSAQNLFADYSERTFSTVDVRFIVRFVRFYLFHLCFLILWT